MVQQVEDDVSLGDIPVSYTHLDVYKRQAIEVAYNSVKTF